MDIVFHVHKAEVSPAMRKRAERLVLRAAARIPRVVEGVIRFDQDGPTRRVTIELRAPKHHDLIGRAEGRYFGPALVTAIAKVMAQAAKEKKTVARSVARRSVARARA